MTEITQMPLQFLNPLPQCPLEPLCVRDARLKTYAPIICLAQKALQFSYMTAKPLDDRIRRLLEFLFQPLNGCREILVFLLAVLPPMNDIANDEQQDCAENDEYTQDFGNGYNNRTPPLSNSKTDIEMYAAVWIGRKTLKEFGAVIFPARSFALIFLSAALPPFALRIILHTHIRACLFLCAHLLARELRILFLTNGFETLLDVDLVLHVALNISRLI